MSRRLALLTDTDPYPFAGSLQTLRLTSCAGCFFSIPAPDKEVKQILLIRRNGSVVLQGYAYADRKHPCRRSCFSVGEDAVQRIFAAAVHYCNECFDPADVILDAGGWDLEFSSKEGGQYRFSGYLWGTPGSAESDFSELLRSCLGRRDLKESCSRDLYLDRLVAISVTESVEIISGIHPLWKIRQFDLHACKRPRSRCRKGFAEEKKVRTFGFVARF